MAARCCWRAVAERGAWRRSMTEPSGARHNGTAAARDAPTGTVAARDAPTGRPRYAELHAHSAFSFLDGASQPEELAVEAARLSLSALALTDHDGLYGVVRFAQAARAVSLPTIFGAELHLPDPSGVLDPPTGLPDPRSTHLIVLARGPEGYRRLSRAIAEGHLATGQKGAAAYTLEGLAEQAAGHWLVLTGCRKGACLLYTSPS